MKFIKSIWSILLVTIAMTVAGCGGDGTDAPRPSTSVDLQSDMGDYIGAGKTYRYTRADSVITVSAAGGQLTISINGDENWTGVFTVPGNPNQLMAGYYANLQRQSPNDTPQGGLDWHGEGRGSNTLTGWFAIDKVTYANGVLTEIDLRFEQHSEGAAPALRGQIRWHKDDATTPAGPVNPPPAGLWQPAPGSTPATGNYVYLQSEAGDYIGAGQSYTYTGLDAQIGVSAEEGHLVITINGNETWRGDFQTMNILDRLQQGYYGGLQRYPFHNPAKGGLDWSGAGRGSNTLAGWFAIDKVTYANGVLTEIDLRFEQHSEGAQPALRGAIHWEKVYGIGPE